jgi:hypothetical protein
MVVLATLVAVALTAGCTKQGKPAATPTTATGAATPVSVKVTASARGEGSSGALSQAADKAEPELEKFLVRFVTTAFDPGAAKAGIKSFNSYFDPDLRDAAGKDLASLSLGQAAARISRVNPQTGRARAVFLVQGGRPVAASVVLDVSGDAQVNGQSNPAKVLLGAKFQLERTTGWRIVAYDSTVTVPK